MQVAIHPSSVNMGIDTSESSSEGPRKCNLMIFDEVTRGDARLYVRQCTEVKLHFLALVAAHLTHSPDDDFALVDVENGHDDDIERFWRPASFPFVTNFSILCSG